MTMLSEHFSLQEMIASPIAAREGINNEPNASQLFALKDLCVNILEPVRAYYGRQLVITSGLRVEALNAKTPGAATPSEHCPGRAADFHVVGVPVGAVTLWLATSSLPFDQCILEYAREDNPTQGWTHASYGPRNRREVLSYIRSDDGKVTKMAGLPVWVHKLYGANA